MEEQFEFVEIKVPAKPEYVGVVRLSMSGIASRMGFSYEDIEDLKVAVSEAITNGVTHAYENDKNGGEVTIGFGIYADRLEVMISDRGESFDVDAVRKGIGPYKSDEPIESLREGGFGLFLIEALMDDVKISNNSGVLVLMTKYFTENEVDMDDDQVSTTQ